MDLKQKILIVDDKLENLHACEKILSEVDAEVTRASDGNTALKATMYNDFALAILDVKMPKMDGYELAELIRNDDKTRELPIIFLSAVYTDEPHIFKGYESGAVDFITKPFNPKLLLNKVKVFLSLDRQKKRLEELVGETKRANEQLNKEIAERKRADEALRRAHDELEHRVEERTLDLVTANEQSRVEIEQRRRSEAALRKSESNLRFLSSELIRAQENERKRISRELHDSLGSSLTAIKFALDNTLIKSGHSAARSGVEPLEGVMLMVRQAIQEVRRIQTDLRPSLLDDLGIVATISWFCGEFERVYSGISVERHISIEEKDVPDPLKVVIFRILQEAFNNVAKYASADLVRVSIRRTDGKVELTIEDNGVGFDVGHVKSLKNSRGGFGLTSMNERTEFSGGSFSIESKKGEGTIARASWQC